MAASSAQQRIDELTTLNALSQMLNRALDLRDALDGALAHVVTLMNLQTGWIFLRDEAGGFRLVARHDLPPALNYPGPPWNDDCTCQELCLANRLDQAVNMVRCSRLRHAVGDKRGLAQHASVPLRHGDEVLGIMNVATTEWGRLSQAQLQLLSAAGFLIGTAIARTQLHEQVKIRRVQEQAALLSLSQDLLSALDFEQALQRLLKVAARLLETEASAFVLADEAAGQAVLRAAHGWQFVSRESLPVVLDARNPHLWYLPENSSDLAHDALDTLPRLLAAQKFKGHLATPVEINGVPNGILLVNCRTPRHFLDDEHQQLGILAAQLAQLLERERLHQEALVRQRLERELDLAREIQNSFLPEGCPYLPGYQIAAFYQAALQVGGDFYDIIGLERGRYGFVIADVTDKGVPAALFMVLSRTLIRATASDGRPPREVLARANRLILNDSRAGLFVTAFYAILDLEHHRLTFADGGHNYPLWYRAATGVVEPLRAAGLVLGIMPEPHFEQHTVELAPGDLICLYTDGVTEAMDARRELWGEERLADLLTRHHHAHPSEIIRHVLAEVRAFSAGTTQADDQTLVVLKRQD